MFSQIVDFSQTYHCLVVLKFSDPNLNLSWVLFHRNQFSLHLENFSIEYLIVKIKYLIIKPNCNKYIKIEYLTFNRRRRRRETAERDDGTNKDEKGWDLFERKWDTHFFNLTSQFEEICLPRVNGLNGGVR